MNRAGTWGWAGLLAYVVGFDLWAIRTRRETLSSAVTRAVENPIARWPVIAAWTATTWHLFGGRP